MPLTPVKVHVWTIARLQIAPFPVKKPMPECVHHRGSFVANKLMLRLCLCLCRRH